MVSGSLKADHWARVYPALKRTITKHLRHGTWYAVVRNDLPDRISVKVGDQTVEVPRKVVEIRDGLPRHFSVITRMDMPPDERSSPGDLGKRYVVCPQCTRRTPIKGEPPGAKCEHCGHRGEIGWWELF